MSGKFLVLATVLICLLLIPAISAENTDDLSRLTILYDAGMHGRYGPCG